MRVVQGNLLGSILSNMLLVLGMAIFAGGIKYRDERFNAEGAAANMTCQIVASISICLPTMYRSVSETCEEEVLKISRVCSLVLALVYFLFLWFQLKTHHELFEDTEDEESGEGKEHFADLSMGSATVMLALVTGVVALNSECLVNSIEDVSAQYGLPKAFIGVILLPMVGNAAEHATAVTAAVKGHMDLALGVAVGSST